MHRSPSFSWAVLLCFGCWVGSGASGQGQTHPPLRPLPVSSTRPLSDGTTRFVDPVHGNDAAAGSLEHPWKTLVKALPRLRPGETLVLRGGLYREHLSASLAGTPRSPITIRSYPGELAILDGSLPEFHDDPARAWEPVPGGAPGEYRSTLAYPDFGGAPDQTNVLGWFADSMVPLHGYRFLRDLRSGNVYWNLKDRLSEKESIYCGPGLFLDLKTMRIHCRLAPTRMDYLGPDNYTGPTDPRKVPLLVAGFRGGPVLSLRNCRHLVLQDLVLRGARTATLEILDGSNITLDGLTIYGGASAVSVKDTTGLRVLHTACRGIAAPWTFRGSLKYRAFEARIFSASGWAPTGKDSRDFEIAYSEFTDCVDGVFLGNVRGVRFHHNLVDNVSDDGIFLTAGTGYDGVTPGGDFHIHSNLLSRCLTTFAFGVGHGRQKTLPTGLQTGAGVQVYRNVFDFRRPVHYHQPSGPGQKLPSHGRFAGDHGGPAWEPMWIHHNTILADDDRVAYSYGTFGLGDHMGKGTKRRIFNNIVVQVSAMPGTFFPKTDADFQADANLFWSLGKGPDFAGDPFAKFRASSAFADSKKRYPPGWGAADRFQDPGFVRLDADWKKPPDLRLKEKSPAVDGGILLPQEWPDSLRGADAGRPDLGALPRGVEPWRIGVGGRLTVCGAPAPSRDPVDFLCAPFAEADPVRKTIGRAAIVEGYPARDVPLTAYALRKQGFAVDILERAWLPPADYHRHEVVALIGDLARAKIEPRTYSEDDLKQVDRFLRDGGTLLLILRGREAFRSPQGAKYLDGLVGQAAAPKDFRGMLLLPEHTWVKSLGKSGGRPWMARAVAGEHAWLVGKGDNIIGSNGGRTILYHLPVGKGRIVYLGWEIAGSLPATRSKAATLEEERAYEEQFAILASILAEAAPSSR